MRRVPINELICFMKQNNIPLEFLEEYQNGSNIRDGDSDNDYLKDGDEVKIYFTNSINPDSDDDGWSDS